MVLDETPLIIAFTCSKLVLRSSTSGLATRTVGCLCQKERDKMPKKNWFAKFIRTSNSQTILNGKSGHVRLGLASLEDRVVLDGTSSFLGSSANNIPLLVNPDVFTGGVLVAAGDVTGDGYVDIVTGAGPGGGPHVRVFDGKTGQVAWEFMAYDPNFRGGVSVAVGDVNGDGRVDIVTGAGPGGGPHIKVFDSITRSETLSFYAFDSGFTGGTRVAVGDTDGDKKAEIAVASGNGGTAEVRLFSGLTGNLLTTVQTGTPEDRNGATVALADFTRDGKADLVVGTGSGVSLVQVFDLNSGNQPIFSVTPYDPSFIGTAWVAAGDVTGDGIADIITGAGLGGGPHVRVFDGKSKADAGSLMAYSPDFRGGVFLAVADLNADGRFDIITGAGPGGGPHVRMFSDSGGSELGGFFAYDPLTLANGFSANASTPPVNPPASPPNLPPVVPPVVLPPTIPPIVPPVVPPTTLPPVPPDVPPAVPPVVPPTVPPIIPPVVPPVVPPTIPPVANTPPTISALLDQTSAGVVGPLAFTVGDAETLAAQLVVSATSSNTELIPNANIFFGGAGASRNILLTPATDKSGTSIITLTVTDSNGSSTSGLFTVTVNSTSVPPPPPGTVDTTPPRVTITTNSGQLQNFSPAITGEASDDRSGVALLQVSIDNGGFADVPLLANGTFSFTPIAAFDGVHLVNFRALDKAGNFSALTSFAFTLDATAPTADLGFTSVVRTNPTTFDVTFSEDVSPSAFDVASYRLSRSNVPLSLASVERLDARRARIHLVTPLTDDANYRFEVIGTIRDAAGNALTGVLSASFEVAKPAAIESLSPANGEEQVSLTRETIVRFDETIDPTTINSESFYLIANGERIAGRIRVSPTEKFATFFYASPLPASTEVRAILDGNLVRGRDGRFVDGNGDGTPGGTATADFRTLPITNIPGTRLFAFIYDSFNRDAAGNNIPVVGATVSLDANPNIKAVTDATGRFELGIPNAAAGIPDGLPAPVFFVHIDGSTAVNAPAGTRYATLGKPFHTVPGQQVQLNMAGTPFNIYLPPMAMGDIVPLNPTADTEVGFGTAGQAQIRRIMAERFPNDPVKAAAQADLAIAAMRVTYPAGSALSESGVAATQATIIPVDPSRLPAPLPPGSNPGLVISIQAGTAAGFNLAGGSTNFDIPAPVRFPNLDGLAPGEKTTIMSFDHDKGGYFPVGTATVSADGTAIVSDPGVGILAPGWHFLDRFLGWFNKCKTELLTIRTYYDVYQAVRSCLEGLSARVNGILEAGEILIDAALKLKDQVEQYKRNKGNTGADVLFNTLKLQKETIVNSPKLMWKYMKLRC